MSEPATDRIWDVVMRPLDETGRPRYKVFLPNGALPKPLLNGSRETKREGSKSLRKREESLSACRPAPTPVETRPAPYYSPTPADAPPTEEPTTLE